MSFAGLLLTYGLNTWLPVIMGQHGYNTQGSLLFLLTLNLGAIIGALLASRIADRIGPKWVIAGTFLLAAAALLLLPFRLPFAVLLLLIAAAGIGTIGTQVLVYGFVSNFYESRARGAGVAWCAGFGRLGGIFGPLIGGFLITAGISVTLAFQLFAVVAVFGALVTLLPASRRMSRPRWSPQRPRPWRHSPPSRVRCAARAEDSLSARARAHPARDATRNH